MENMHTDVRASINLNCYTRFKYMALLTKEFTLARLVLSAPDCKTGADWGSNLVGYSDSFLIIC